MVSLLDESGAVGVVSLLSEVSGLVNLVVIVD